MKGGNFQKNSDHVNSRKKISIFFSFKNSKVTSRATVATTEVYQRKGIERENF